MSTEKANPYIGQIFFEGSSTLLGVGDESGQGGYRGRLEQHYSRYSLKPTSEEPQPECPLVSVYGTGMLDRTVGRYAFTLADELDLVSRKGLSGYESRMVAVLLMGSSLLEFLKKYDNNEWLALDTYCTAMDTVQKACETRGVSTIGVGLPLPREGLILPNGARPSRRLRETSSELSRWHMEDWQVPHDFLSIEEITDPVTDRAPDGAHLNSAGYEKITQALVGRIDSFLGIDSSEVV